MKRNAWCGNSEKAPQFPSSQSAESHAENTTPRVIRQGIDDCWIGGAAVDVGFEFGRVARLTGRFSDKGVSGVPENFGTFERARISLMFRVSDTNEVI